MKAKHIIWLIIFFPVGLWLMHKDGINIKLLIYIIIGGSIGYAIVNQGGSIPEEIYGKQLTSVIDQDDYLIVNEDKTFILFIFSTMTGESWKFDGKVDGNKLVTKNKMEYFPRVNYKPVTIESKIEILDDGDYKGIRIFATGFNTIEGKETTTSKDYLL